MSKNKKRYLEYNEGLSAYSGNNCSTYGSEYDRVPLVYRHYYLKNYLGRLLTAIEVLGLPEKQEKPFKDVIKTQFYDLLHNGMVVPEDLDIELSTPLEELVDMENVMSEEEARKSGIDVDKVINESKIINI